MVNVIHSKIKLSVCVAKLLITNYYLLFCFTDKNPHVDIS